MCGLDQRGDSYYRLLDWLTDSGGFANKFDYKDYGEGYTGIAATEHISD